MKRNATALSVLVTMAAATVSAQTFTTLFSFDGTDEQGAAPSAGLFQARSGEFYGATSFGGDGDGGGTIFGITSGGTLKTLYTFCTGCKDGAYPFAGMIQAKDGYLYGTTNMGGNALRFNAGCVPFGCGTVFKITPSGALTTLHRFCARSGCTDGAYPYAGLIQANDGDFYGTTGFGGAKCISTAPQACGTVFKITRSGRLTTLYSFCSQPNCADGEYPMAGVIQANDGNLYGTTYNGGANPCEPNTGCGTVFRITPSGILTALYSFCSEPDCADGADPLAGLVQAANGDFYGTTYDNGYYGGYGTVFKITPSGKFTTLHRFCSAVSSTACLDGANPRSGLIQAANGEFYGTTQTGGANNAGTIFRIAADGKLTTVYSFCSQAGCADGQTPYAGLVQAINGDLYGTTLGGGDNGGHGTVYRLSSGLSPATETQSRKPAPAAQPGSAQPQTPGSTLSRHRPFPVK